MVHIIFMYRQLSLWQTEATVQVRHRTSHKGVVIIYGRGGGGIAGMLQTIAGMVDTIPCWYSSL